MSYEDYNNLGYECFEKSDHEGAIKNFLKAVELEPNNIYGYYSLGVE